MPQFDVHENLGRTRTGFPFLVVVQSNEFPATLNTLVVPMTHLTGAYPSYAPAFEFKGTRYVADALALFPIPTGRLGRPAGSLSGDDRTFAIIAAIDRVISTVQA